MLDADTILVTQGEMYISYDPKMVMTTLVGSCIAACMFDSTAKIGGMNHFLLPDGNEISATSRLSYGFHAMECLINGLIKQGARKSNLCCKLFGGANIRANLGDIGTRNAAFATDFLNSEGISCVGSSLGGDRGRRIRFWPATGRAQQLMIRDDNIVNREVETARKDILRRHDSAAQEVEFF
ncbi:chemotaxis protein CheD [Acetobacter sp. UBA5411]|uniref:chemotaxis protein CheD n=1 Tax=Acetobacter sp. UBA5411 TaxID=1945905 RepID=UPI0025C67EFE|nr:chemotaxis protein CheD [Acetobacter sp. UBA5411]